MTPGPTDRSTSAPETPLWQIRPSRAALPPSDAQVRGVVLLVPIALLSLGPYFALWGLPDPPFPTEATSIALFFGAFVLGTVFHEVLHGLGHAWGEATWSDVRFGMHWRALTPFARCDVPTRARSYRLAVALPGLVLGGIPLGVGLTTGYWLAAFYGFLMLVAAAGDLLVLWILRNVPAGAWVQDHPREVGCLVVAGPSADSPSPISEDELTAAQKGQPDGLSLGQIAFLLAVSLVFAAVGFLIALA